VGQIVADFDFLDSEVSGEIEQCADTLAGYGYVIDGKAHELLSGWMQ
jgi:hypothetical protein